MDWGTVITSAAIGSIVSSVTTLFGQRAERNARKRELRVSKAIEMGMARGVVQREQLVIQSRKTGMPVAAKDDIFWVEENFRMLSHLFDQGRLDPKDHDQYEQETAKFDKLMRGE